MCRRLALAALLVLGGTAPAAVDAAMRAEQIIAATAPELLIGGPDAIGGVGDWYLANDVVEVVVDDPGRRFAKLNHGGTIVDAGLRDRAGEDQFARIFPIVNMDQRVFIDFDAIRAEVNEAEGWARLVVSNAGRMNSVRLAKGWKRWFDPLVPEPDELRDVAVATEYTVFRGEPFVHITTTFRNQGPRPAPILSYGDVWMRGGRSGRSWVGNTLDPVRSRGFQHLSFDRRNILASGDAMAAFTYVSVPGTPQYPPIAYAIFAPERTARQLRQFGVTGKHVTLVNAFAGDPDWEAMSLVRLAAAMRNDLAPGESWTFRRRLLITGHADTASTTDVIFPLLGYADGTSGIQGRVEPANIRHVIHVSDAETGAPITQIATATTGEGAGSYRAILPPGAYDLTFRAAQHRSRDVAVSARTTGLAGLRTRVLRWRGRPRDRPGHRGHPGSALRTGAARLPDRRTARGERHGDQRAPLHRQRPRPGACGDSTGELPPDGDPGLRARHRTARSRDSGPGKRGARAAVHARAGGRVPGHRERGLPRARPGERRLRDDQRGPAAELHRRGRRRPRHERS
jgi:hypothetical protein